MTPSRREFLKMAAATGVTASIPLASHPQTMPSGGVSPNDRIQLATIGAGGQGMSNTRTALELTDVELVAVADVYDGRLVRSKELWGDHIFTTRDYREVLARPD